MKLPLFPLASHLLPEGRLALRIFEPRYTRMVKQTCEQNSGFVICMLNPQGNKSANTHIFKKGTFCQVIDFDILKDGLLGITVEGKYCVDIDNIETEEDELRIADCMPSELWRNDGDLRSVDQAVQKLKEIFEQYPEVSGLYAEQTKFEDAEWVINRWIELLPLNSEQKQYFMQTGDKRSVVEYLNEIIE